MLGRHKSSVTSSEASSVPCQGINLSITQGIPFPLQNPFTKGRLFEREGGFSPEPQMNTSREMMMLLNRKDCTDDDNMPIDEESDGRLEGEDEDDEENNESEPRARMGHNRENVHRGTDIPSEGLRINNR